jgi:hypothetical protein
MCQSAIYTVPFQQQNFCLLSFVFCLSQLTFEVAGFALNVSWPIQNLR